MEKEANDGNSLLSKMEELVDKLKGKKLFTETRVKIVNKIISISRKYRKKDKES